jgi:adenosylcobyric acid synthase
LLARTLMVQGTASSVGKSILVTALCRLFRREGLRVAPFKAQNMALNSFVTPAGGEIGRAQAVQAEAAGVEPAVEMNPILLKPEGDARSQVVVLGKAIGSLTAADYHAHKPGLRSVVADSLAHLRRSFDLVIIEGAGSPVEINLKDRDIVNMHVARIADAPVLLVGDIDRGGVFAAFVGTMELLEPDERARVAAFVVNKFRGDVSLLVPGLEFITQRTRVPVLGVVPYIEDLRVAEEDSVALEDRARRTRPPRDQLDIVVVRLPRISNYDDVQPLEHEPGVTVRFIEEIVDLLEADLVILPGSKSTASDLAWLRARGLADVLVQRAGSGRPVLGICGGCQMLGRRIKDPHGVECGERIVPSLGLLPIETRFERQKITAQVGAKVLCRSWLADTVVGELSGYEIHMGVIERDPDAAAPFEIVRRNGRKVRVPDGAVDENGTVVGTMIHGLFGNETVRASLLRFLRRRKGAPEPLPPTRGRGADYDTLAAVVRRHVDWALLQRLVGVGRS